MYNYIIILLIFFNISYANTNNLSFDGLEKLSTNDIQSITSVDIYKDDINLNEINSIINELYNSPLIFDLEVFSNNSFYNIEIKESKIVKKIFINGNQFIQDIDIFNNIKIQENNLLNKKSIINSEKIIKQLYSSKGFNDVSITTKTENFSYDQVNLIFDIEEGTTASVSKINFIGNEILSDSFLSNLINSRPKNILSFFSSTGILDENLISYDREILIRNYNEKGFFEVEIEYLISKNIFNSYTLDFYINEGNRTKISEIIYEIDNNLNETDLKDIADNFELHIKNNEDFFDGIILQNHLDNLIQFAQKSNLSYLSFDANLVKDNEIIVLRISSNKIIPKLVNKVNINGNSITKDKVIRSKIHIETGDYVNDFYFKKTKEDLEKLPYINKVTINKFHIDNNKSDINLDIEENKKTGNISFAGFFSSDTGAGISLGTNDTNIFGTGNQLSLDVNLTEDYIQFKSSYSKSSLINPYLRNNYFISNLENDLSSSYGFKSKEQGIGYGISFKYSEDTNLSGTISYKNLEGYSPNNSKSSVNDNIGSFQDFILDLSINTNTTNDIFYPTKGYLSNFNISISPNDISDNSYYKLRVNNSYYIESKSTNNFYFANSKIGIADSFDGNLKTLNTFSLGGNNFLGFDYKGIGQLDDSIYLGGNKFFTFTVGAGGNLIFDKKDNIYFKSFLSTGSIWDSDYINNDKLILRSSLGVSIDVIASSIPITFTYAIPLDKELNDKTRLFSFAIGTSF